tara:strand:+ start:1826 stop:2227 length:402 start_codon:yes stop_codon:yes gene_type:complete
MSLLTIIDQVPLYTTIEEALIWGTQYNITGYHTHVHNGVTGYMPGQNHEQITSALAGGIINFLTPQQLAQGQFVVTPAAAQAYMNQQSVALPSYTPPQPVVVPQQQETPAPITTNTSTPTISTNRSSGGRSGY